MFGAALSITMIDAERRTERRTGFVRGFDFYRDDQDYAVEVSPGGRRREEGGSILSVITAHSAIFRPGLSCPAVSNSPHQPLINSSSVSLSFQLTF